MFSHVSIYIICDVCMYIYISMGTWTLSVTSLNVRCHVFADGFQVGFWKSNQVLPTGIRMNLCSRPQVPSPSVKEQVLQENLKGTIQALMKLRCRFKVEDHFLSGVLYLLSLYLGANTSAGEKHKSGCRRSPSRAHEVDDAGRPRALRNTPQHPNTAYPP